MWAPFDTSPTVSAGGKLSDLPVTSSGIAVATSPVSKVTKSADTAIEVGSVSVSGVTIGEQLFTAVAEAKVWTSRVAMHLERERRNGLFAQLDTLHELDEWAAGDKPVALESFKNFVRAIVYHRVNSRPALSLMPNGNVLALWQDGSDRLTVEFLPTTATRWMVRSGTERATGMTPLERLRAVVQPYGAERWFDGR